MVKLNVESIPGGEFLELMEIEDCEEGCLLDNYIGYYNGVFVAVFERYINPNMSGYEIIAATTPEEEQKQRNRFERLREERERYINS